MWPSCHTLQSAIKNILLEYITAILVDAISGEVRLNIVDTTEQIDCRRRSSLLRQPQRTM
jgi:hypothetical protein